MPMRGSIRLTSSHESPFAFATLLARSRSLRDARKALLTSFPLPGLPLRIRPAFVVLCGLSLVILSLLGFHPTLARRVQPPIPFSDKLLHFVCFAAATALFYAVWYVEPDARVLEPWRNWPEYSSIGVCMLAGGIGSEFVQSLLPYKEFQLADVIANLLGSALGIYIARHITIQHRKKKELRRLYDPLDEPGSLGPLAGGAMSSDDDDEEEDDRLGTRTGSSKEGGVGRRRLDVWNADADSLFELGGDDELDRDIEAQRTRIRSMSIPSSDS